MENGYTVRGEVRGCDVVAEKDGETVVLEMKRHLSVDLLGQAAMRQRWARSVYVVVPHPGKRLLSRQWKRSLHLLKRLELGLIFIQMPVGVVEVAFHPLPFERKKRKTESKAVILEVGGRSGDYNVGGSTGIKVVTAYRESAIMIACFLDAFGPLSPSKLKGMGTGPKTGSILYNNFYGWFDRVSRGLYALSGQGKQEASSFKGVWRQYAQRALALKEGG